MCMHGELQAGLNSRVVVKRISGRFFFFFFALLLNLSLYNIPSLRKIRGRIPPCINQSQIQR